VSGLLVVDRQKCLGCHSCEIACTVEHSQSKSLYAAIREDPLPRRRVEVEHYSGSNLPLQCRHCEDAPCVRVCPTKALFQKGEEEVVLLNSSLCIGCKWCLLACPFGVITLDQPSKSIIKCDLCQERASMEKPPACAESCPTKALQFTSTPQYTAQKRKDFLIEFLKAQV
jgi:anaerobic carbon-monoxide dehydrogenase iron sulfur subunit